MVVKKTPKVYILILNWNGWKDTIECLESVFKNSYSNFQVVVVDNASTNDSMTKIKEWAEGQRKAEASQEYASQLINQPFKKPIPYKEYGRDDSVLSSLPDGENLILIQTGKNLGFAGGNNVGLRYSLTRGDFQYIWLLNNDTVIKPDALIEMVVQMEKNSEAGICGSTLLYYHEPFKIQALGGGKYNKWLGVSNHIGVFKTWGAITDDNKIEKNIDYVIGASLLVKKSFLKDIGLMNEDYFLYFEELDWVYRAKGKYSLTYASKSIVYHKEGGTIGSSSKATKKSFIADYYTLKNRITFTRNFCPFALPTIYLGLLIAIFNRIRRGQYDRVSMIIKILLSGGK